MVTRREFIQASALLGGVAIGGNSFSPLRAPGNDFAEATDGDNPSG